MIIMKQITPAHPNNKAPLQNRGESCTRSYSTVRQRKADGRTIYVHDHTPNPTQKTFEIERKRGKEIK